MLTRKKDLRTGSCLWASYPAPGVPAAALTRDMAADVVVIGAGITGAMLSEELCEAGFSVIVIDSRGPMKGSTSATTALLQAEIDEPLTRLARKIGQEKARRTWRRAKLGLESLHAKILSLDIRCELVPRPSLYLAGDMLNAKALQAEADTRLRVGLFSEYINRKSLWERYGIRRAAALRTYNSLCVNPYQMTAGFLNAAHAKGARIFAPVNAKGIEQGGNKAYIHTTGGYTLTANHVVFATGYEIPKYIKTRHHNIHSTWAIATRRQPRRLWPEACLIWEASDPYLYLRTTMDGRIICGGEDEDFTDEEKRDALIAKKTAILEKKLEKLFPHVDNRAEFAWAGCFGGSTTGLPAIGAIPGLKHCFSIMAFGGNGITYARIAAEVIRAQLTGKEDTDADLFTFKD